MYKPEEVIPVCPNCQTPMVLRTKGEDKFWGCPNWKDCGGKTMPYGKERPKDKPKVLRSGTAEQIILEEIKGINDRLTKLGTYLKEKLG